MVDTRACPKPAAHELVPSSAGVSRRMSRQPRRDTAPELLLRRRLHRLGLRFRVDHPLPGLPRRRADLLLARAKLAVFVDGCFWHACPDHATFPAANEEWWRSKLARNVERDKETDAHLRGMNWAVLRFWEHEDMNEAAIVVHGAWQVRRRLSGRRRGGSCPA